MKHEIRLDAVVQACIKIEENFVVCSRYGVLFPFSNCTAWLYIWGSSRQTKGGFGTRAQRLGPVYDCVVWDKFQEKLLVLIKYVLFV